MAFRSGIVALVGKPNVGKSTIVNALVGQRVSIISSKPQTTRRSVLGVVRTEDFEVMLIDTPGIHEPHSLLGKEMVHAAKGSLADADLVVFVADASRAPDELDQRAALAVVGTETPIVVCLNKMDRLPPEFVTERVEQFCGLLKTEEYMLCCATKKQNLDKLRQMMVAHLPEQEPRFDEDTYTDQNLRFMAAELIREKVLNATRQEIPHATTVYVQDWEEGEEKVRISAVIIVEKASQRAILIGKGGQFVKQIGTAARLEIQELCGKPVFLDLVVKVEENWRMNTRILHELREYE